MSGLAENPAPSTDFASAIMKVTENLIYISEIVSSDSPSGQTCAVCHSFSLCCSCCPHAELFSEPGCLVDLVLKQAPYTISRQRLVSPSLKTLTVQTRAVVFPADVNSLPSAWYGFLALLFGNLLSVQVILPEGLPHCVINVVQL